MILALQAAPDIDCTAALIFLLSVERGSKRTGEVVHSYVKKVQNSLKTDSAINSVQVRKDGFVEAVWLVFEKWRKKGGDTVLARHDPVKRWVFHGLMRLKATKNRFMGQQLSLA